MTLYVYDTELLRVGIVEDIRSLQWLACYQDAGEVKLLCNATDKNLSLLVDGHRLYCSDQTESAVIRAVEINDDGSDPTLTVRAVFSVARWADRVVMATENITGVEAGMLAIVSKNRRGLPGTTAVESGLTEAADSQITWGSVLDACKELAKSSGLGFRETFDPDTATECFEVYKGVDRRAGDSYNGYFSDDADNLAAIAVNQGTANWKNTAIVGGQGEGASRKIITVSLNAGSGDELRELWVDAKDITTTYQLATPDGSGGYNYSQAVYTDAEYTAKLEGRGLDKLAEQLPTVEVSATLGQGLMVYGVDYSLGDIVPLKHSRYGLNLSARVTKVKTVYESTGKLVAATLEDYSIIEEAFGL